MKYQKTSMEEKTPQGILKHNYPGVSHQLTSLNSFSNISNSAVNSKASSNRKIQQSFNLSVTLDETHLQMESILSKLTTRRKRFTMQLLKQFLFDNDLSLSIDPSLVQTNDRLFMDSQTIIHTLVKISETKMMEKMIWAFLNIRTLRQRQKMQKFTQNLSKFERKTTVVYKHFGFERIKDESIKNLLAANVKLHKMMDDERMQLMKEKKQLLARESSINRGLKREASVLTQAAPTANRSTRVVESQTELPVPEPSRLMNTMKSLPPPSSQAVSHQGINPQTINVHNYYYNAPRQDLYIYDSCCAECYQQVKQLRETRCTYVAGSQHPCQMGLGENSFQKTKQYNGFRSKAEPNGASEVLEECYSTFQKMQESEVDETFLLQKLEQLRIIQRDLQHKGY